MKLHEIFGMSIGIPGIIVGFNEILEYYKNSLPVTPKGMNQP
jgi:hypothetical protein